MIKRVIVLLMVVSFLPSISYAVVNGQKVLPKNVNIFRYSCKDGFVGYAPYSGYIVLSEKGDNQIKGRRSFKVAKGFFDVEVDEFSVEKPLTSKRQFWVGFWRNDKNNWAVVDGGESVGGGLWFLDTNGDCNSRRPIPVKSVVTSYNCDRGFVGYMKGSGWLVLSENGNDATKGLRKIWLPAKTFFDVNVTGLDTYTKLTTDGPFWVGIWDDKNQTWAKMPDGSTGYFFSDTNENCSRES